MFRWDWFIEKLKVGGECELPAGTTFGGATITTWSITLGAWENLIASSTSDITVNTDKFTVAWTSGNTVVGWTLTIAGAVTNNWAVTNASTQTMSAAQKLLLRDADISVSSANDWYMDLAADTWVRIAAPATVTSAWAAALAVGRLWATTPALNVDASTATSITGINIKSAASGNWVAVSALWGTNEALTIDAKWSGTITIAWTSTGAVTITPATTITGALTQTGLSTHTNGIVIGSAKKITGAGTWANGIIIDNPKNAAAATMSGTARTVEIAIGWTPYYFLVYPTAS